MEAGPVYDRSLIENIFQQFKNSEKGHRIMDKVPEDGDGPSIVEAIFKDLKGCRAGLIKALTTDVDEFLRQCDPEKDNLCLYGFPDATWGVSVPVQDILPELPDLMLDIRSLRNGMPTNQWLRFVAVRCDSWLHYVAFHTAYRHGLGKSDWTRLFSMINDLCSMYDTLLQSFVKQIKDKSSASDSGSDTSESPSSSETGSEVKEVSEDEWANDNTICGICKKNHSEDEFRIRCEMCEKWLHGMCVKITKAEFPQIKEYKCPSCCKKP